MGLPFNPPKVKLFAGHLRAARLGCHPDGRSMFAACGLCLNLIKRPQTGLTFGFPFELVSRPAEAVGYSRG